MVSLPLTCQLNTCWNVLQAPSCDAVQAAWEVHRQTGWNHPAWREAYSLAQLCLAASYIFPERTETPHTALPAEQPLTGASQCSNSSAPAVTRQNSTQQGAQIDPPPELARLNHHRQGSAEQGSMSQGSLSQGSMLQGSSYHDTKQGSRRQGSLKQDSPTQQNSLVKGSFEQGSSRQGIPRKGSTKQGSHSLEAMQALDLASIMGAPPEMLAPLLNVVEPMAKQAHQASLAQQNNHSLHPAQQSSGIHPANPLSQQQGDSMQHNQKASPQQTSCQANSAVQISSGWITEQPGYACVPCSCHVHDTQGSLLLGSASSCIPVQLYSIICRPEPYSKYTADNHDKLNLLKQLHPQLE